MQEAGSSVKSHDDPAKTRELLPMSVLEPSFVMYSCGMGLVTATDTRSTLLMWGMAGPGMHP